MNLFHVNNLRWIWSKGIHYLPFTKCLQEVSAKNVVLITGCDSGIGFNLALYCHSMNMTVISGCLDINSDGAKLLKTVRDPKRMITLEIDLLKEETILNASSVVWDLITNEEDYQFTALVNNAGIMCFGEFEWQTNKIFEKQIKVNLLGTMRITKEFLPLIRKHKSRIINVTSHCGLHSLPGLGPYSASKGGLTSWNNSLRMELKKYGVHVINLIPGSMVMTTNISAWQQEAAEEMWNSLTAEQKEFYSEYFMEYNNYLKFISGYKRPTPLEDTNFLYKFKLALLDKKPKSLYKNEPFRYKIYYLAFRILPIFLTDWLTKRFVQMPEYHKIQEK